MCSSQPWPAKIQRRRHQSLRLSSSSPATLAIATIADDPTRPQRRTNNTANGALLVSATGNGLTYSASPSGANLTEAGNIGGAGSDTPGFKQCGKRRRGALRRRPSPMPPAALPSSVASLP